MEPNTIRHYFETDIGGSMPYKFEILLNFVENNVQYSNNIESRVYYDSVTNSKIIAYYLKREQFNFDTIKNLLHTNVLDYTLLEAHKIYSAIQVFSAENDDLQTEVNKFRPYFANINQFADTYTFSRIVYIYGEGDLNDDHIAILKEIHWKQRILFIIRGLHYAKNKSITNKPLAFISHDSRDKESLAIPLVKELTNMKTYVWYDAYAIQVGDSLTKSIEKGLNQCKKCIMLLTKNFISNNGWTRKEFEDILAKEIKEGKSYILPIWYNLTDTEVREYSSHLADIRGLKWEIGLDNLRTEIIKSLNS